MTPTPTPTPAEEVLLFEGRPALVPSFGVLLLAIVTLGLWLIPLAWRRQGRHYRITTRRIVVESGVLSKRLEQIDLYRISDYTVERSLSQRLVGTGSILLRTLDKSAPTLDLIGLRTDVVALYERLRAATEADQARRGVRIIDNET